MRYVFNVIIIFFLTTRIIAVRNDSLVILLQKAKEASYYDSVRFFSAKKSVVDYAVPNKQLNNILPELTIYTGNYFFYTRNLDSAAMCFGRALKYANQSGSSHFEILAKIRLQYVHREYGIVQNALADLNTLLSECILKKDIENELEIYNLMAIIHEEKGDYKQAVEYYVKGLTKAELNKEKYYQSTFLNNLGLIRYSLNELDNALNDFNKSVAIAKEINNERLLNHAKMNLCLVLVAKNDFVNADSNFRQVLKYAVNNKLPLELASAYANLASAYLKKNEYEIGIHYVDSAISVFEKYHFKNERVKVILSKCDILLQCNKLQEANSIMNANESEILASADPSVISGFHLLRSNLMYKMHNYKEAYENYDKYFSLKDSLRDVINARTIDELQLKYNVQKKEIELEREKSKSLAFEQTYQKERFFKWIIVFVALIVLIGGGLLVYMTYNRKMREKQHEFSKQLILQAEEERSRIARDLHDDIGQSLSILKAKIYNNGQKGNSNKDVEVEIERIVEQTRQIARALYPSYIEKMGLIPSVAMLAENVQKNKGLEVSFEICKETEILSVSTKTHLFHIIQESVNNTIRHSGATALKIMIDNNYGYFNFTYLDNGSWVNNNKPALGIGLLSMKERVKIIKGISSIDQNYPKGFKLTVKFNA